MEIIWQANK